jgi:8-oxo-dGTP pyrophosphatase MutT (NUDIX family)
MSVRPDIVECWPFRVAPPEGAADPRPDRDRVEILLIRRAPDRIFPGLWQCVTGGVEAGERVALAAMRELEEETGLGGDAVEAYYDLDQVAPFYDEGGDAVVVSAIFAARIRFDAEPLPSNEHDGLRWVPAAEAPSIAIWPAYAESVRRIQDLLFDPELARWFALDREGRRVARRPLAEPPGRPESSGASRSANRHSSRTNGSGVPAPAARYVRIAASLSASVDTHIP